MIIDVDLLWKGEVMKYFFKIFLCTAVQLQASAKLVNDALELAAMLPKANIGMTSSAKNRKDVNVQELWDRSPDLEGIVRVPVLQQGFKNGWPQGKVFDTLSWDQIKSYDGANCGYHALKNVLLLMNAFEKDDATYLEDLTSSSIFFDFMSLWSPIIFDYRNHTVPLNNLHGSEIELLLHGRLAPSHAVELLKKSPNILQSLNIKLQNLKRDLMKKFEKKPINIEQNIAIIEPLPQGISEGFIDLDSMEVVVQDFIDSGKDGMIGVVLTNDTGGHWVGFVMRRKEGHMKVFYMNSTASKYGVDTFLNICNS